MMTGFNRRKGCNILNYGLRMYESRVQSLLLKHMKITDCHVMSEVG
jgi:hypothetical protein